MLDVYGFRIANVVRALGNWKCTAERLAAENPTWITPAFADDPSALSTLTLRMIDTLADELGFESTRHEVQRIAQLGTYQLPLSQLPERLDGLQMRIEDDLKSKQFLFVPSSMAALYGEKNLFGDHVANKFPKALADIANAGSCLALKQPTACVFHLMRAMEVAVKKLSTRLGVTVTPKTTWRQMTAQMDSKIKALPEATAKQREKKNAWKAARVNLRYVRSIWRNNTMHPASTYTPSQALELFNAVRSFMVSLASLG